MRLRRDRGQGLWGRRAGFRRARCVALSLLTGCLILAGCGSVRPLELAPPDRMTQTSLALDAKGRGLAALRGPEDRTAADAAGRGRHRGGPCGAS